MSPNKVETLTKSSSFHHFQRHGQLTEDEHVDVQRVRDLLRQYAGSVHLSRNNDSHSSGNHLNVSHAHEQPNARFHLHENVHSTTNTNNVASLHQLHDEWADQERELCYYMALIEEIQSRHVKPTKMAIQVAKERLKEELTLEQAAVDQKKILLSKALNTLSSHENNPTPDETNSSSADILTMMAVTSHPNEKDKVRSYTPLSASHSHDEFSNSSHISQPPKGQKGPTQPELMLLPPASVTGEHSALQTPPLPRDEQQQQPQQQQPQAPRIKYASLNSQYLTTTPETILSHSNTTRSFENSLDMTGYGFDSKNGHSISDPDGLLLEGTLGYYKRRLEAMKKRTL